MTRRRLLMLLVPTFVAVFAALAVGFSMAKRLPTSERVDNSVTIEEALGLRFRTEHLDDRMSLALMAGTLGMCFAASVLVIHISAFPRVRAWRERAFGALEPAAAERRFIAAAIAVGLVLSGFLISYSASKNLSPDGAEVAYLEHSIEAAEQHGVAGFPLALYSGRWSEDEQHPLQVWLLTPLAFRSFDFFVLARGLAVVLSVAAVALVTALTAKSFGKPAAALTAILFGTNWLLARTAPEVSAEPLALILFVGSFYLVAQGFDKPRLLVAAGALAGLAWMARVTGLLLPVAFVPAALATWGWRALRNRYFYLYFAAFAIAASPLVARNIVRYGNPFHEHAFGMFWIDKPEQRDIEEFARGEMGPAAYLAGKGLLKPALRISEGFENVLTTASQSSSLTSRALYRKAGNPKSYEIQRYVGLIVLVLAGLAVLLDARRGRRAYIIALAASAALFVGWYSRVTTVYDLLFPFVPLVLAYFAVLVVSAIGAWQYRAALLVVACIAAFYGTARRTEVLRPRLVEWPSMESQTFGEWVAANIKPDDVYLMYDDTLKTWFMEGRGRRQDVPNTPTIESLVEATRARKARYIVISKWLLGRRVLQFSNSFQVRGNSITPDRPINGWKEVYRDPDLPVDYIIYEVLPADGGGSIAQEAAGA